MDSQGAFDASPVYGRGLLNCEQRIFKAHAQAKLLSLDTFWWRALSIQNDKPYSNP